jgi:radical SAM protein with 4Fe4S-binding SPASM domain
LVENVAYLYNHKKRCTVFVKINGDIISKACADKFREVFEPISDGVAIEHTMSCWDGVEVKRNPKVGVYGGLLSHVNVCPYIFYSFCVNFDGVVSPCFLDWNRRLVLGSLSHNTLKEIWEGNKMRYLRLQMLKQNRNEMPVCKDCNQLEAGEPVNIDGYSRGLLEAI